LNIEYFSYSEEVIKEIKARKIHVFSKNVDLIKGKDIYLKASNNIFELQPKFMLFNQLKNELFLTDRIILKEEKQAIAFFRALSREDRKNLGGVKEYFDIIDIAGNFFNFFKIINEYQVEDFSSLNKWQKELKDVFFKIRDNYEKLLDEKKYSDLVFSMKEENFSCEGLKEYDEIIIYNKLYFTPFEKEILKKLEKEFKITLKLQLTKGDFDEENLKLKKVSMKEKLESLEVYTTEDEFVELLKIAHLESQNKEIEIYDANSEKYIYNNYFNKKFYLSDIPFYRLMEGIHNLISNVEIVDSKVSLSLKSLADTIKHQEMIDYYEIEQRDIFILKDIIKKGYKYINLETLFYLLENDIESTVLPKILKHIEKLYNFSSLKEWVDELSFDSDKLLKFKDENIRNDIEKYFEAKSEVVIIEEFDLVDSWKGFFSKNKSEGLLRIIMKYHKFKALSQYFYKMKKSDIEEVPTAIGGERLFINISDSYLPKSNQNIFLFNDKQKKELGILNLEEERLQQKYNFFRGVFTSKSPKVIAINSEEKDSFVSPFVEELCLRYKIEKKELILDSENFNELTKLLIEREEKEIERFLPSDIDLVKNPFKRLNAYSCDELFRCKYKMFLRYILKLEEDQLEVEENLTYREYGNIVHEIFEEILKFLKKNSSGNYFEKDKVDSARVKEKILKIIERKELKLPRSNKRFYEEIIYENLSHSVVNFLEEIRKVIGDRKITDLRIESRNLEDLELASANAKVKLDAKADLIIELEDENLIIDFKTGKKNDRQLDFYSILFYKESNASRKFIYNVDEESLEESEKIVMTKESLLDELEELYSLNSYERKIGTHCNSCEYKLICRGGEYEKDN